MGLCYLNPLHLALWVKLELLFRYFHNDPTDLVPKVEAEKITNNCSIVC